MTRTSLFDRGRTFWILLWLCLPIAECFELIGSGCYNNAGFWIDNCPKNKVIHVKRAFYGKRWPYSKNDTTRCKFTKGDCIVETDYPFERCNHKPSCYIGISTLWVERSCEAYPTYTDYIQVHYDCVYQGALNTTSVSTKGSTTAMEPTIPTMYVSSIVDVGPHTETSTRRVIPKQHEINTPPVDLLNRLKSLKRQAKPTTIKTSKERPSMMKITPTEVEPTATVEKETRTVGTQSKIVDVETPTYGSVSPEASGAAESIVSNPSSERPTTTDLYKSFYPDPLKPPYLDELEYYDIEPYPTNDFTSINIVNPLTKNTEVPKTEPTRHIWYIWSEKNNQRPKKAKTLRGGDQKSRIMKIRTTYPALEENNAPMVSNRNHQEENSGIKVGKWITGTDWGIGLMCLLALLLLITMAILVVVTRKIRERRKNQPVKTTANTDPVKPTDNKHQPDDLEMTETNNGDDISTDTDDTINGKHKISRKIAASAKRLFDKKQKGRTDSCDSSISIDIPDPKDYDGVTVNPAFKDSSTDSDMHSNSIYGDCNIYDNNHYAVTGLCEPPLKKLNETMEDKIRRLSVRSSKGRRKSVAEEGIYEEPIKKNQVNNTAVVNMEEENTKSDYSRLGFMHQHLPQWGKKQHKMYLPDNDSVTPFQLRTHNPKMNKKMETTMQDWYLKAAEIGHLAMDDIINMIPDDNEQDTEIIEDVELTPLKRTRTLPYKKGSLGRMFGRMRRSMKATLSQSDKGASLSYNHEYPTIYAFVNGPDVSHGKLKKKTHTLPLRRRGTFPKKALTIKRDAWKRFGGSFKIPGSGKRRSSILNRKEEHAPSTCSSKQSSIVDLTNTRKDQDEDYLIEDRMSNRRFTLPEPNEEPLPLHLRNAETALEKNTMENFRFNPLLPKLNHFNNHQRPLAPSINLSAKDARNKENRMVNCEKKAGNIPQAPPILDCESQKSPSPGPPKHKPLPPDIITMETHNVSTKQNVKPSSLVNTAAKYEVNNFAKTRRDSQQVKELQQNIKDVLNKRISEQIKRDTKKVVPHPFKKDRVFIKNEVYHTPCDVEGKTSL